MAKIVKLDLETENSGFSKNCSRGISVNGPNYGEIFAVQKLFGYGINFP